MKNTITLLLLAISFTASAQISTLKISNDAYYTVDRYKTTFHYRYTPTDEMPKSIKTNINGLLGAIQIFADVEIDGEWVILKRIKMEQENNALSSVKIAMGIETLFYKNSGKQHKEKKLKKSKGIKRWADNLIGMIKQY
ncbi:hypothetical protein N9M11_03145 [Flavobacteriaceae bacterium]|uniref:hypothetical protein n=1 Tax=Candidatus Arcticimaribacter forsetii TaxID=2820661 RepID=UPI0020776827|nr:hypothetical protein [Candidatus Arcticimaribacter forsetii]MDA8699099.1 hypothetical protein [Flavobacteriaceae bacterium]MDB2345649.1 hypothetical protein [Flavobacteriaceae bacterium]MDB4674802.1 hypothetical protein [Flavobacteriaceae bacterium]MDB4716858.1 hypothetical protein [Flavobacteriaceae bacterium]